MLGRADFKAETQSCRGIPRGTFSEPSSEGEEGCTNTVLAKAEAEAPLRADLGCSSSYSSRKASRIEPAGKPECGEGFPANSR